jgi:hypothetical protein
MNQPKYQIGQCVKDVTFTYGGDGYARGKVVRDGMISEIKESNHVSEWVYTIEPLDHASPDGLYWVSPTNMKESSLRESDVTPAKSAEQIRMIAQRIMDERPFAKDLAMNLFALIELVGNNVQLKG